LKEEIYRLKTINSELRDKMADLEERIVFLNSKLADLTIDGQETCNNAAEIYTLNERISSLEAGLAEYESQNRGLVEKLDRAQQELDKVQNPEELDSISKQNKELKQEISDLSEKMVDMEQENGSLKEEADQLDKALDKCASLAEQLGIAQKINQELEAHLSRKKKHIDQLQGRYGLSEQCTHRAFR